MDREEKNRAILRYPHGGSLAGAAGKAVHNSSEAPVLGLFVAKVQVKLRIATSEAAIASGTHG